MVAVEPAVEHLAGPAVGPAVDLTGDIAVDIAVEPVGEPAVGGPGARSRRSDGSNLPGAVPEAGQTIVDTLPASVLSGLTLGEVAGRETRTAQIVHHAQRTRAPRARS